MKKILCTVLMTLMLSSCGTMNTKVTNGFESYIETVGVTCMIYIDNDISMDPSVKEGYKKVHEQAIKLVQDLKKENAK